MTARLASNALMLGNLAMGMAVLAPAGMLLDLSHGLGVSVRDAGLLVAWGGVVLCIASPLVAWACSALDRRRLLAVALAALTIGQGISAFAPDYATVMAARLVMLALAAIFTPVAAATIAQLVEERLRARSISYVFLGWSLALAAGLPVITWLSAEFGWRAAFAMLACASAVCFVLLIFALPRGIAGTPMPLASWGEILKNPRVLLLLVVTLLWTTGMYTIFPYLAPLVADLAGGGTQATALLFATVGIMGVAGNLIASRIVVRFGAYRTTLLAGFSMLLGTVAWASAPHLLWVMMAGAVCWGLGVTATNSMIQARLVAAAPAQASAAVALNTSWLYVGQALGSWIGGEMIVQDAALFLGSVAAVLMGAAFFAMIVSRDSKSERGA